MSRPDAANLYLPAVPLVLGLVLLARDAGCCAEEPAWLGPSAVAVTPDGSRLFVACARARRIRMLNLPAGAPGAEVEVPYEPTGLALDATGQTLYVTCAASTSQVLSFEVRSLRPLRTWCVGHTAVSPVVDTPGSRLYVCNRFDNDVSVLDLATGRQVARVPVPREPVAAALSADGRRLLVANHLPHRSSDPRREEHVNAVVTVVNTRSFEVTNIELFSGASSVRGICVTPDGRYAFVSHLLANFESVPFRVDMGWINVNVVSIVDLTSMQTLIAIGLDDLYTGSANPWGIACSEDGSSVWVSSSGTHQVSQIATAQLVSDEARRTMSPLPGAWPVYPSLSETMWNRVDVSGRGPRALVARGNSAFIAEYFSDSVSVLSLNDQGKVDRRSIALGPPPQLTPEQRGELLFHDANICYQRWQCCASCHPDGRSDALNWDLMNDGVGNPKNTKSMLFAHRTPPAMIKGVRATAEIAVRSGLSHILFASRPEDEATAIDAYLRSLRPVSSPHRVQGQLSESARRGRVLFESRRVGCSRCHSPPLFTDRRMHHIGQAASPYFDNAFDTPTLVEVWRTAPYLHDGKYTTITELLQEGRHGIRSGTELSDEELADLAEYVLSL